MRKGCLQELYYRAFFGFVVASIGLVWEEMDEASETVTFIFSVLCGFTARNFAESGTTAFFTVFLPFTMLAETRSATLFTLV